MIGSDTIADAQLLLEETFKERRKGGRKEGWGRNSVGGKDGENLMG